MKYIIVAKDRYKGDLTSDAQDPLSITEIATELVITRLYLIILLHTTPNFTVLNLKHHNL